MDTNNTPNIPSYSTNLESHVDDFDFKRFLGKLIRDWWIFMISIVAFLGIAYFYCSIATPQYNVQGTVLIVDDATGKSSNSAASADVASSLVSLSSLFGIQSNVDNELSILQTMQLLRGVVNTLKLNVTYYKSGVITSSEIMTAPFTVEPIKLMDTVYTTSVSITYDPVKPLSLSYKEAIPSGGGYASKNVKLGQPFFIRGVGILRIVKKYPYYNNAAGRL